MGEPREPPNYEEDVRAFLAWVDGAQKFEVIDPDPEPGDTGMRPFVVKDDILEYFEDDCRRLKTLISLHFPVRDVWKDDVIPDKVAVFCTLLSISKGWWIKPFRHHDGLSDIALPFDPTRPPPDWPEQGADFLPQFCEAQWKFCAPVLSKPFMDKRFPKDMVLPIVFKKTLNKEGSSASLWLIKIHPSCNNLISKADKEKLGPLADTFVMKTYFTSEAKRYYNTEVAAFRNIGLNSNIIEFHGSFTRGDSYNVLLEYADKGNLADYFENESPPSEGEEIIQFWEAMFTLIGALQRIHQVGSGGSDEPGVFQGRHKDVKPENILIVSNGSENRGDWTFKLADLGISNFKRGKSGRQDSADENTRGTRTYGAPESYRPGSTNMHDTLQEGQNSDIWSLGCIFSEAARWLKDGHRGIMVYRQERERETSKIPGFRDGDCFHNGEDILNCVRQCHKNSVQNLRPEDVITRPVVGGLIETMLTKAGARSNAYALYQRSIDLVKRARDDLETDILEPKRSSLYNPSRRPKNRRSTVPNQSSRPQTPPNPPPGVITAAFLHAAPSSSYSPRSILEPSYRTSEPERVGNLRHSSTRSAKSHSPKELSHQSPEGVTSITHDVSKDIGSISGPQHRLPDPTPGPGARYKPPSQPRPQSTASTTSSHYCSPPSVPAGLTTFRGLPSVPSSPHTATATVVRPISQARPVPQPLSLGDALEWKRNRKGNGPKVQLSDSQYLDRLKGRDHVFLIDDSESMSQYWKQVREVFEALSYIVKQVDPDGFDLWFTGGSNKPMENCQKSTAALQAVELRKGRGATDINVKLTQIFDAYIDDLRKPRHRILSRVSKPIKPLNLYVLTDGVWEEHCDPRSLVGNFVRQLDDLRKVKGSVGIQFISFGQDPVGLKRMRDLDSSLNLKLDIVDTEPWDGDVWKMLLGAINETYDNRPDSGENVGSSSFNRMSMTAIQKEEDS
ncbi:hypothetical protein V500_03785 [Pseudogymnoascus sp. VKM F-4518 (FW-2643)]|nr:hypothetical protein V500_03785 [Pseudogymnoascus sp. VKM F-4518 (FW-2643)]